MINVADRAERWAAKWSLLHKAANDAVRPPSKIPVCTRCYLCRRTEQELGVHGMPPGFWLCPQCKDKPPTERQIHQGTEI
jgi:hypothetical protein